MKRFLPYLAFFEYLFKNITYYKLTVNSFFLVLLLRDKVLPVELILLNLDVGAKGGIGGDKHDL